MTRKRTHGRSRVGDQLYRVWSNMRGRCLTPTNPKYPRYGGRGITVCDRWSSFETFVEDMGPRPKGTSLDRVDNNGNYTPENCRWASAAEQMRNRSTTRVIVYKGMTLCLSDWSSYLGVPVSTLHWQLARRSVEEVFSKILAKRR